MIYPNHAPSPQERPGWPRGRNRCGSLKGVSGFVPVELDRSLWLVLFCEMLIFPPGLISRFLQPATAGNLPKSPSIEITIWTKRKGSWDNVTLGFRKYHKSG